MIDRVFPYLDHTNIFFANLAKPHTYKRPVEMEQIIRQHADLNPHSEAVIDGPNSLTYHDLLSKASDLAQLLGLKEPVRSAEPIGILLDVGY